MYHKFLFMLVNLTLSDCETSLCLFGSVRVTLGEFSVSADGFYVSTGWRWNDVLLCPSMPVFVLNATRSIHVYGIIVNFMIKRIQKSFY